MDPNELEAAKGARSSECAVRVIDYQKRGLPHTHIHVGAIDRCHANLEIASAGVKYLYKYIYKGEQQLFAVKGEQRFAVDVRQSPEP